MPFVHFLGKTIIFEAFSLVSVKMYVIHNVLQVGALSTVFCSQSFPSASYVAFLTAVPYGFAFNHTILFISCVLLASKIDANVWQILQISKLLALTKANVNAFNAIKNVTKLFLLSLKLQKCNYNMMSFSGHPVCHLGLNWCILLGVFLFF